MGHSELEPGWTNGMEGWKWILVEWNGMDQEWNSGMGREEMFKPEKSSENMPVLYLFATPKFI